MALELWAGGPGVGLRLLAPEISLSNFNFLKIFYLFIYLFIVGGGRKRERNSNQYVVASCVPPPGNLAWNPGMCPDWESNQRPFGLQAGAQSTELHQPGLEFLSTTRWCGTSCCSISVPLLPVWMGVIF